MEEGALNISHMAPASSHVGILLLLATVHTWPMVGMAEGGDLEIVLSGRGEAIFQNSGEGYRKSKIKVLGDG